MKKWCLGMVLALCAIVGLAFAASTPAAAEGGAIVLPKGDGSGTGFIYYDFVETTEFKDGDTYAFLDAKYGPEDAVAQLGSGAVLQATSTKNNCDKYIRNAYGDEASACVYVDVVTPGKGFDRCPSGGLYKVPDTSGPTEYRYFCWAGGARNCGPLYAYTYKTAEITWDNVTVSLNDPGNTTSSDSADYTVELTYGDGKSVTLDPRSYEVSVDGRTATITITDNDGNAITGTVTLPCGVTYQPGGQNVTDMPDSQGILPDGDVTAAAAPSREGYEFQGWSDGTQTISAGASIPFKSDGDYTLTAVWKDTQAPTFTCDTVEVTTGTSGEVVQNSIKAALKITDNEPISECAVTVAADDATAKTRGEKQVSVTVTDKAGNEATQTVTVSVLPGPLSFSAPTYTDGTLSATLLEPGPDTITETGIVWSVISNPTTTVNNGRYFTTSPATEPDTSISTRVELAQGVTYYTRAYAVVDGVTYYGPQATIGDNVPSYGTFTISNNGSNTFTISRSGGTDGAQTVYYRTVNGSAVAGTHYEYQSGTVTFAAGETSKTITVTERGVNATYDDSAATGYSNASRTYSVEIYRVDGGAVIEGNRDEATRTMTGNQTVDRGEFEEKTTNGDTNETERGDYEKDGNLGWTQNQQGSEKDLVSVQPTDTAIRAYVQAVTQEIRFYVTFDAREQESGYQAIQIVPGSQTDTSIYPYDNTLKGSYSDSTLVGYTALIEHGGTTKDYSWASYRFPVNATAGNIIATTINNKQSKLTAESWKGDDTGDYLALPVTTEQVTVSYGACGEDSDKWYTKNVVYHYQFIDTEEPSLLAIGDMGDSIYRVGDSFTVSLIFDEIVDSQNSDLANKTIATSWGTATYAGGADTNVLYFTGTVSSDAASTLSVSGTTATIRDMAGNAVTSVSGSTTASVDTRTPSFTLSSGSISGGVGRATISDANNDTTSLRYAWSQSSDMPATGWVPLTREELAQAKTADGFQAMTRRDAGSGEWYLHVLGACDDNGALAYQHASVDFGDPGSTEIPGDTSPAAPSPTISVSVDNTNWATSRTITVTSANGSAAYRYGDGEWQPVSGDSVTVDKNGTYAFRCVSASGEAATASATVDRIDTTAPTASIGAMTANTPTQNPGVYRSVTLPVSYVDAQSGVSTAVYAWSSSATAPSDDWTSVGSTSELTYTATENDETSIYLHLKVTDQVGNTVTVTSPAYQVISPEGAKAYAPTVTIGLAESGGEGFTAWDGNTWTNETQTLVWKLVGDNTNNCVVTLPDGRTTTDTSGTILVSQNGTYAVSVVDNTYGGSNSSSFTIDKIDTTAPTVSHDAAPEGWQPSPATIEFTFEDQGGSGLESARYAIVEDNAQAPTELIDFSSPSGGEVTVSQDGTWYVYYEVTDGTAGTYGDGTSRAANTTSGFVGPIQINTQAPTLQITGGMASAASLELSVASDGSVTVSKNVGEPADVSGTYTVTEAGTYTFTATSNAGLTTKKTIEVFGITFDGDLDHQLVVSGGTVTKPADPTKTGYTFEGWYAGGTAWDFSATVTADLNLKARWTLDTPTVTLRADKTSVTYGEAVTLTADASHPSQDVTLSYAWYKDNGATPVSDASTATLTLKDVADSGSYRVTVTASYDGQTTAASSSTVEVTIAPRPVELTWDYQAPFTYDKSEKVVTASVANLVGGDSCCLTYGGATTASGAGSYEASVTALGNANYTLEGASGTTLPWEILQAEGTASVSLDGWTYDGTAKNGPVPSSETNGTDGVSYRYTGTTASGTPYDSADAPTQAGAYTVTATFPATDNYEEVVATADFTIDPLAVTLTWDYQGPFTYDKSEKVVTAAVANRVGDDPLTLSYSENAKADAGTYTAEVTALGNPNYTLEGASDTTLSWEILQAEGTASVSLDGWTYGDEAGTPAPSSETNGTDHVTYRYTGTTASGEGYDSPDAPTQAGAYKVTATFAATQNYEETTAEADFSIAKRRISGTWQGLSQVYDGSKAEVGIILNDLVAADQGKAAVISSDTDMTSAGDHALTATLDNYEITNGTATLVIRQKTVIVTVADNAVAVGGEPTVSVPGVAEGDYVVTYKDASGDVVTDTSQPGTYEVWVLFTNKNYCHSNGTADAQVGTFTVTAGTPTLYDVTFDGNGADGGSMTSLRLAGGSALTLPECGYTKTGHQFVGWLYGGRTYQPGKQVSTAYGSMTVKAQWQAVFEVSGIVTEWTEDGGTQPVSGAVVSLWLGANKVDETSTYADGTYGFADLLPGTYNLVASKDVRTVTSMATIADASARNDVVLPVGATNSVVEVTPGSPDIVVGNLDTVFEKTDETVYTEEDAATVKGGGKVEITFTADERQAEAVADELEKLESVGGGNLSLFLGCTLTKTVYDEDGIKDEEASTSISQSTVLLDVRLPLPSELQGKYGYTVARVHDGEAQVLGTTPNDLGEYYEVGADRTYLTLHVRCFSVYAVGYRNAPSAPTYPPVLEQSDNGTFTVSPSAPTSGQVVTIAPEPNEGYVVGDVTVLDQGGKPVEVTPNEDGTFSFVQPAGSVTISVSFLEDDGPSCPRDETCPLAAFEDLDPGDWYHDGVHFCLVSGLMTGYGDDSGLFGPADALSREQAAMVLWRALADGSDAPSCGLSDVEAGQWYTTAVDWAYASGFMTGYADGSGLFGVGDALTRDQFAMMLANVIGADLSTADPSVLDAFSDGDGVAEWAVPAVSWAVESGILEGSDDGEGGRELRSGAEINRAEMAAMAMRAFS